MPVPASCRGTGRYWQRDRYFRTPERRRGRRGRRRRRSAWMIPETTRFSATFKLTTSFCSGKHTILSEKGPGSCPISGRSSQE
jgi:hypothetical protein